MTALGKNNYDFLVDGDDENIYIGFDSTISGEPRQVYITKMGLGGVKKTLLSIECYERLIKISDDKIINTAEIQFSVLEVMFQQCVQYFFSYISEKNMDEYCVQCIFTKTHNSDNIEVMHNICIEDDKFETRVVDIPRHFFLLAQMPHMLQAFQLWENDQEIPGNYAMSMGDSSIAYDFDFGSTFIGFVKEENGSKHIVLGDFNKFRFTIIPIECYKRMTTYTL
jgi:hypothetical protein